MTAAQISSSPMISHERGDVYFNYRSCGIAINGNRVLAVKIAPYDFWLFPGGRVEYMESSSDACLREVSEELGVPCKVERLVWIAEDFYLFEGQKTHELCHYYFIDFSENPEIYEKDQWIVHEEAKPHESAKSLTFRWIPLDKLEDINLIPKYIKAKLSALPHETELVIVNHLKPQGAT